MAEVLGLSRNSVTNYIHDRTRPPHSVLMVWSMKTGVPLDWLQTGEPEQHLPR